MNQQPSPDYVRRLEAVGASDIVVVGAKAANLGELLAEGFPVPNGVVVTTAAYRELTTAPAFRDAVAAVDGPGQSEEDLAAVAERVRKLAMEWDFDGRLDTQLQAALDTATNADVSYAVRSSATAEDLPTASFAGQYETYLGVSLSDVPDRVRACLTSVFTERAIAYRSHEGISTDEIEMAVIVQEMVDADAAGVLFTADPDSGNRTIAVVDATYGLGDTLVSGEVNSDHIRIDRQTGEMVQYEIGDKAKALVIGAGGLQTIDTPSDQRTDRVLSASQIQRLTTMGGRVERLFDRPQDIEWALVGNEFVLLQSRPITSLPELPQPQPDDGRLHVYFSMGHAQAMTDPMPPLALDLWAAVYGDLLNHFVARDYDWVVRSDGRAYLDTTPFLTFGIVHDGFIETVASINEAAAAGTAALLDVRADEFETRPTLAGVVRTVRSGAGVLPSVARTLPGAVREGVLPFLRGAKGTDDYRDWFHTWGRNVESSILRAENPEQLVENAFGGLPPQTVFEVTPKAMRLIIAPVTERALQWVVPGVDTELITATTRGSEHEIGTRMILGLSDLADSARSQPDLEAAVRAGDPLDVLRRIDGGEQFCSEFEAFLDEFGHRTAGEFDPSRPRWRDDPAIPLALIRSRLDEIENDDPREQLQARRRTAKRAVDEILARSGRGFLGAIRRPLVAHLLRTYRSHVQLRDEPKHGSAHLFAAWHEALQRVGDHLADEGTLADATDIWFLHRDELDALLADSGHPTPDIDARRQTHEQNKRVDAPPLLTSEGEAPRVRVRDVGPNTLVGTGVSGGVVEGRARVVRELAGVSLDAGDVLVCASSDPAWTPLFATASALVTEVGGRLTHGALVAREYGLPAVASVQGATTKITDGQRIRVDGDTGTVELLTEN